MSKYTLHFKYQAVLHYLHIRSQQRTADHYGISRTHLRRWIRAYQEGGIGALEHPQSKTMPQHRKTPSSPTNPTTKKHRRSLSKSCAICAQRLPTYRELLAEHSMIQSMSRKANCWDNAPMESFFAVLKTECFYNAGELTVDELMKQIDDYMDYYNRERCSLKLKKLSPVAYRTQLAQSA